MELSLKGKKILITGAGAGIGLACAEAFVTAGAEVAICDVEQARLDEALASLTAIGGNHYGQLCDVASADAVADFFANSVKALGALDIVLNNAGVGSPLGAARGNRRGRLRSAHGHQSQGRLALHAREPSRSCRLPVQATSSTWRPH